MSDNRYTVVTALFDLASREPTLGRRDISFYHQHGQELFKQPLDLIIYYDSHLDEAIKKLQRPEGYDTTYIPLSLEQTEYYTSCLDKIKANRDKGCLNCNPNKDTILYTVVQWTKFQLLRDAAKLVSTSHICWVDYGLHYVGKGFNHISQLQPSNKFKVQCLRPTYPQEVLDDNFFRNIMGRTSGGIFLLPTNRAEEYYHLFDGKAHQLLDRGLAPLEDAIVTYLRVMFPDKFDVYYGDYEDIVHNFNDEIHSQQYILELAFSSAMHYQDTSTICILGTQILNNAKELIDKNGKDATLKLLYIYVRMLYSKDPTKAIAILQKVNDL